MAEVVIIDTVKELFQVEVPEVILGDRFTSKYNPDYKLFRAGEWSFELPEEEEDIEKAREGIGAWIAWYLFLSEREAGK